MKQGNLALLTMEAVHRSKRPLEGLGEVFLGVDGLPLELPLPKSPCILGHNMRKLGWLEGKYGYNQLVFTHIYD